MLFDKKVTQGGNTYEVFLSKLKTRIEKTFKETRKENYKASKIQCERTLNEILGSFNKMVVSRYSGPDGLDKLREDIQMVTRTYHERAIGPARDDVLEMAKKTKVI